MIREGLNQNLPSRKGTQVGHDVEYALLGEGEEVEEGHEVALPLRQQLLHHSLPKETYSHTPIKINLFSAFIMNNEKCGF